MAIDWPSEVEVSCDTCGANETCEVMELVGNNVGVEPPDGWEFTESGNAYCPDCCENRDSDDEE